MNILLEKLSGLTPRERILLGAGVAAAAVIILYSLVWQPWQQELNRLRLEVPEKTRTLAWMRAQVPRIQALRQADSGQSSGSGLPLLTLLERSATSAEIRQEITRMSPGERSNQVRVWMDDASFDRWLRWLESLKQNGIEVAEASVDRTEDNRVNIRTTLQR